MKRLIFFLTILSAASLAQTGARYLIITYDDYYNALIPLAEWKTRKGLKAKIVRAIVAKIRAKINKYIKTSPNGLHLQGFFYRQCENYSLRQDTPYRCKDGISCQKSRIVKGFERNCQLMRQSLLNETLSIYKDYK